MADWRHFNASNKPDTCIWCGRKLRFKALHSHYDVTEVTLTEKEIESGAFLEGATTRKVYKNVVDKRATEGGDYQDGFFCGLRCAYQFGVRMAQLGRRLNPKEVK
jgi:hypothetical protein